MKFIKAIILSICVCFLSSFFAKVSADTIVGKASIIDGDTIEIRGRKIRLNAIDAFEASQLCFLGQSKYKCGNKAAWYLDSLTGSNAIKCYKSGVDRYKRIIAECYSRGVSLNQAMVLAGWALAYRQYSDKYISAEIIAKNNKSGAWKGEFVAPWDYRANNNLIYSSLVAPISSETKYKSCKEAKRDGVYRIKSTDPKYNPKLDRDKDGVACE